MIIQLKEVHTTSELPELYIMFLDSEEFVVRWMVRNAHLLNYSRYRIVVPYDIYRMSGDYPFIALRLEDTNEVD